MEFFQREIVFGVHVVEVFHQLLKPVAVAFPLKLRKQMVGQVSGESFSPVAACRVDVNAVAPPVVQDFVGIRGFKDEGEADQARSQQGERRHGVTGFKGVFHHGELDKRISAEQFFVKRNVRARRFQIAVGEFRILAPQENIEAHVFMFGGVLVEPVGDQENFLHGIVALPESMARAVDGGLADAFTLAHHFPFRRRVDRQ